MSMISFNSRLSYTLHLIKFELKVLLDLDPFLLSVFFFFFLLVIDSRPRSEESFTRNSWREGGRNNSFLVGKSEGK